MITIVPGSLFIKILCAVILIIQILTLIGFRKRFDTRILLHRTVLGLFFATLIFNIDYILLFFSPDLSFANVGIHFSFILFDVVIFWFYAFVEVFTGTDYRKTKRVKVMAMIQTIDIISLIISIFTGSMYKTLEYNDGNEVLYAYETGPVYPYLLVVTTTVILMIMFLLIRRAVTAPAGFGKQYYIVALITVIIASSNIFFLVIDFKYDLTTAIITLGILLSGYYAVFLSPAGFQRASRERVIDETSDGIIVFNYHGECSDINKAAKNFFGSDFFVASQNINTWIAKHGIDLRKERNFSYEASHLAGTPHFKVYVKPYNDGTKRNVYAGTYIRIHDKTSEDLKEEQDYYNATHDLLTGLLNREAFFEEARSFLENCVNLDHYLICGNIANFKLYNNLFTVEAGNILLKNIAECLQENLHEYNLISRVEADRFCVIMPRRAFDEREFKLAYADALNMSGNGHYSLNVYLGVCEIKSLDVPPVVMYNRALMAAQSIRDFADQYTCFYDEKIEESILETQNKVEEIRRALDNDEFVFYIQPQITPNGEVVGGEALVRWNHPKKGIVSPFFFIDIMEEHGLIEKLDFKVWEMVCEKLREWKDSGLTDQYISVNISAKDFYYMNIYDTFIKLTEKYDIDRKKLRLEITESAVMQDEKNQIGLIDKLCEAGFVVEIDDFGSGYSSLNMLNKLHAHVLKLDMGFLHQSDEDARTKTILESIMNMAKGLDMKTIAEGVETKEQAEFLNSIGCDVFQGHLFSPPISVPEYESRFIKKMARG